MEYAKLKLNGTTNKKINRTYENIRAWLPKIT